MTKEQMIRFAMTDYLSRLNRTKTATQERLSNLGNHPHSERWVRELDALNKKIDLAQEIISENACKG